MSTKSSKQQPLTSLCGAVKKYVDGWSEERVQAASEELRKMIESENFSTDRMLLLSSKVEAISHVLLARSALRLVDGDATAWNEFNDGVALFGWKTLLAASAVGKTKYVNNLKSFRAAFEHDVLFVFSTAIWLKNEELVDNYTQWLKVINENNLLGQFKDDEEQINFSYHLAELHAGASLFKRKFELAEKHRDLIENSTGKESGTAIENYLNNRATSAVKSVRYQKAPYYPLLCYALVPTELLALLTLTSPRSNFNELDTILLMPSLFLNPPILRVEMLSDESQKVIEFCKKAIHYHGGLFGA